IAGDRSATPPAAGCTKAIPTSKRLKEGQKYAARMQRVCMSVPSGAVTDSKVERSERGLESDARHGSKLYQSANRDGGHEILEFSGFCAYCTNRSAPTLATHLSQGVEQWGARNLHPSRVGLSHFEDQENRARDGQSAYEERGDDGRVEARQQAKSEEKHGRPRHKNDEKRP